MVSVAQTSAAPLPCADRADVCLRCVCPPLQLATCADIKPISRVGTRFVCPNDRELDPTRGNTTLPSTEACCSKVSEGLG